MCIRDRVSTQSTWEIQMMLKGLTELRNGKPELCNARLNFELRKMKCTFSFFENIKGNIDAFSRSVDKSISIFKKSVPFFEKHKDISELVLNLNNVMRIIAGVSLSMQEQLTNLFGPFLQHYENTSREMIQKLSKIVDDTSSKANKLFKVQEKYKEKMAKYSQNEENKSKAKAFDDAKTDYVQQIQIYNQVVDQNKALFKEKLDLLLQQKKKKKKNQTYHLYKYNTANKTHRVKLHGSEPIKKKKKKKNNTNKSK
eukprot:TRINITY_DN18859_c0_g1_i2.p1 TRINITY_DN18859_c0_g1~~TRINITY_DN18859_c0_g1_i2.p1  ORF type:complete len:255 (-),score=52.55 TRINITY_DN18859_c0_g1_i2:39-803(-)